MNQIVIPAGSPIIPFLYIMLGVVALGLILYNLYMFNRKG